jgi:TP901 family phage tail tape measure protein
LSVLEKTIEIIFQGDDRTGTAFSSVDQNFGKFSKGVEDMAGKVAVVSDAVIKLDLALAAMAAGGIALAINEAGNFDTAFREIATIAGVTGDELENFRQDILRYAQGSTQSLSDITGAIYESISRYTEYGDSIAFITQAEVLSTAGRATLRDTTILLASAMSAYGADVDEAGRYSDVFFQIVKEGGTTLGEVSDSFGKVVSSAAATGVSVEELGAALAVMTTQGGMPTNEAMTALNRILLAILDPASSAAKAAAGLGVEFSLAALESKGLAGFLGYVYEAAGGNVEQIAKLFTNTKSLTGALALFGPDGGDLYLQKLNAMYNAHGSSAEAAAIMEKSYESINQTLQNNLKVTMIVLGDQLLGVYKEAVDNIITILQGLSRSIGDDTFKPILDVVIAFGQKLSDLLGGIAASLPEALKDPRVQAAIADFGQSLQELGAALGGWFGNLDLTKPEDLAKALETVTKVLTGLVDVTTSMVKVFDPFIKQFGELFLAIADGDDKLRDSTGQMLAWGKIVDTLGLEWAASLKLMQEAGVNVATGINIASDIITAAWNAVTIAVKSAALVAVEMAAVIAGALDTITFGQFDFLGDATTKLEDFADRLRTSIQTDMKEFGVAVDDLTGGIFKFAEGAEAGNLSSGLLGKSIWELAKEAREAKGDTDGLVSSIDGMPDNKNVAVDLTGVGDARLILEAFGVDIDSIPEEKLTELAAATDNASISKVLADLGVIPEEITTDVDAEADHTIKVVGDLIDKEIPDEKTTDVDADPNKPSIDAAGNYIDNKIPDEVTTDVDADPNKPSIDAAGNYIDNKIPDEVTTDAKAKADEPSVTTAGAKLDAVANPRTSVIEPKVDELALAAIEGQFALMQSKVEWKAKLDIAEVEANAKIMEAAFSTLSTALQSSADIISSAFGAIGSLFGSDTVFKDSYFSQIMDVIYKELALRERAMNMTEDLINTQIEYMKARMKAMESGDGLITIDGAGLQPHLEAFMWEVLAAIQTRVNEEGHAMLFGTV